MIKVLVAVLLLTTATTAGKKQQIEPQVLCRVMALDPLTKDVHIGKWIDCTIAEDTARYIYDTLDHPGLVIWTDQETKEGKKWSDPVIHSKPEIIPIDDFGKDWIQT